MRRWPMQKYISDGGKMGHEPRAFSSAGAVYLQDMDVMSGRLEQRTGELRGTKHSGALVE